MGKKKNDRWSTVRDYDPKWVAVAERRTRGLLVEITRSDVSLQQIVTSAYMQGLIDSIEIKQTHDNTTTGE